MTSIGFDQMDGLIWLNGDMIPWQEAKVHILTHGLHYASCVFEGQRAYNGKVFRLTDHSQRLIDSAKILDMDLPYSAEQLDAACVRVLQANSLTDAYVRPLAWRGSESMGLSAQGNEIHVAIAAWEWPSYFSPEEKLKGIRLTMSDWRRPDPKSAPHAAKASGLYMICTLSNHKAHHAGYADALMLDWQGRVAEATSSNIFLIKGNKVHTPIADCFLNGLTRQTVISMAPELGYEITERRIMPEELGDFDECFLTGSAAEITPVSEIDNVTYTPGVACKTFMQKYSNLVRGAKM